MNPKPTFLLVDDDLDDQDFFISALGEIDDRIKCITANDGIEALSILNENSEVPDFIFLDQNMPRMTGLSCLREIKKIPPLSKIPVVMYSTSQVEKDKADAHVLGADYFFVKTHSFRTLVSYLRNLAENTTTGAS